MTEDTPLPGEIDLETGERGPEIKPEPAEEVAAAPADETPAEEEPAKEEEAPPAKPKATGLLAEMIEYRTRANILERERQQMAPVLSRLTPEMQRAIVEGRVMVNPLPTNTDDRQAALSKRAERLRLYTNDEDGKRVLDLDAAARVEAEIRDITREETAPLKAQNTHAIAKDNYGKAVAQAKANGYSDKACAIIEKAFADLPPNLLADSTVAMATWENAIKYAELAGVLTTTEAKAAVVVDDKKKPIVADASGRRGTAALTMSPKLQAVYKNHGLNPAKSSGTVDWSNGVSLED